MFRQSQTNNESVRELCMDTKYHYCLNVKPYFIEKAQISKGIKENKNITNTKYIFTD